MEDLYCRGCGSKLQCSDETKEGYIQEEILQRDTYLCKRCYQLKHYGKFVKVENIISPFSILKKKAKKEDLIIIMLDASGILSCQNQEMKELKQFPNKICIFNHFDWISSSTNCDKLKKYLGEQFRFLKSKKIFIYQNDVHEIFDYIEQYTLSETVFLLGNENVGKTTFMNLLLKYIAHEKEQFLLDSAYPGTTLQEIAVPITEKKTIIDLPGIQRKQSFLHCVEEKIIKDIVSSKTLQSYSFQLKEKQAFLLHNYAIIYDLNAFPHQIVFYLPNHLKIMRCKLLKAKTNFLVMKKKTIYTTNCLATLQSYEFELKKDEVVDIVIEGLCFFRVFSKGKYKIDTFPNLNIHMRKSMF